MKKRMSTGFALVLMVLLLSVLAVACGAGTGELDGKALTEERCTACHSLDRVKSAKKTADEWTANVERMVEIGAQLNEAEQKAVIEYLSEAYPK